ncbi:pentapeptide repeat-containing protein [Knoellia locipacati]|uniref:pentapeptide repeat-containing protein n=1 Tax=Knoellia locipacati TaxID=882824 RepID=UPI00384E2153
MVDEALGALVSLAPGEVLRGREVVGEELAGLSWESAKVIDCVFEECILTSCNLTMATLTDTRFVDCTFVGCKLLAVNWTATGAGSMLAQPLRFERSRLDGTTFAGLDLTGFVFRDCQLTDVDFSECDLRRADLGGSDVSGARFADTDLSDADLRGTRGLALDPRANRLKGARLDLDAAPGLLEVFGLTIS